jgi:hypothetical protein
MPLSATKMPFHDYQNALKECLICYQNALGISLSATKMPL